MDERERVIWATRELAQRVPGITPDWQTRPRAIKSTTFKGRPARADKARHDNNNYYYYNHRHYEQTRRWREPVFSNNLMLISLRPEIKLISLSECELGSRDGESRA